MRHFYENYISAGQQDTILGFCNVAFIPIAIFISFYLTQWRILWDTRCKLDTKEIKQEKWVCE